jgi:uncharacterized protein YggE
VRGVAFGWKDQGAARAAALAEAARSARGSGGAIAGAFGMRVVRVRPAESVGASQTGTAAAGASGVKSTVTLVLEIA